MKHRAFQEEQEAKMGKQEDMERESEGKNESQSNYRQEQSPEQANQMRSVDV